jgi:hypothetical protein
LNGFYSTSRFAAFALNFPAVVFPAPDVVFIVALRLLAFNFAVVFCPAGALEVFSGLFPASAAGFLVFSAAASFKVSLDAPG